MLTLKQQNLIAISAFTSKSDVSNLKITLNEAMAHLYAYVVFPPSIRGINTFSDIIKEREAKSIKDEKGKETSPITDENNKYSRGEKAQMIVTGLTAEQLTTLLAFNPLIDVFLKEHLFADIFGRDSLSCIEREMITVLSLASLHDPFVRSRIGGALNVGVTEQQLKELFAIIENKVGKTEADTSRKVLDEVIATKK